MPESETPRKQTASGTRDWIARWIGNPAWEQAVAAGRPGAAAHWAELTDKIGAAFNPAYFRPADSATVYMYKNSGTAQAWVTTSRCNPAADRPWALPTPPGGPTSRTKRFKVNKRGSQ